MQQELLQKCDSLNTLVLIKAYCDNYEAAKADQEKLSTKNIAASAINNEELELSEEEIVAAISAYNRKKNQVPHSNGNEQKNDQKKKCRNCGYDWPHPGGK